MTRTLRGYLPLLVWLALVWVLLWGMLTPAVLLSAVVLAPLCLLVCRLPPLRRVARPRWRLLPLALGRFALDVTISSLDVAWATVRRGPRVRSAVVAVPFRSSSDVVTAVAANRLSLVPGTLVLEFDPSGDQLYVYVLDVARAEQVESARDNAVRGTSEVVRALGALPARDAGEGGGRP